MGCKATKPFWVPYKIILGSKGTMLQIRPKTIKSLGKPGTFKVTTKTYPNETIVASYESY